MALSSGTHHMPTSADACINIVHSLMCHRQEGDSETFCKKAIESLIKKLKEKRDELDSLIIAITTAGAQPTKCVTIPRTLDGRLQVAGRKGFPHVMYSRIWRWPDVHKNELKHFKFCAYGFDLKMEGICVNPYHYERVIPTGIDLGSLSIHHSDDNYSTGDQSLSPDHHHYLHPDDLMLMSNTDVDVGPNVHGSVAASYGSAAMMDSGLYSSPTYMDSASYGTPFSPAGASSASSNVSASTSAVHPRSSMSIQLQGYSGQKQSPTAAAAAPSHMQLTSPSTAHHPQLFQPQMFHSQQQQQLQQAVVQCPSAAASSSSSPPPPHAYTQQLSSGSSYGGSSGGSSVGYTTGHMAANNLWSNSALKPETFSLISLRQMPEHWCCITYFELDQKVGEIFKVPSVMPMITVDGYTDPSSPERFCLGKLTSVHRSEIIEKARLHIGRGVQLVKEGEGDVWVRCLSDHSIFVQSFYLDRQAGRQPGDAVHKIYPAAFIKVFDLSQCHDQMKQCVAMAQNTPLTPVSGHFGGHPSGAGPVSTGGSLIAAGIGADDLLRLCTLRLSFVKGWGPDYPRETIKDTPCWIEIKLNRALQLVDDVLQSMPLTDLRGAGNY